MSIEQASADDGCTFGKWLHVDESFRSEHGACWQELHDLHEQFHRNAGAVLDLATSGRGAEAEQRMHAEDFTGVERRLKSTLQTAIATAGAAV